MSAHQIFALCYAGPVASSQAFVRWLSGWEKQVERGYFYWLVTGGESPVLVDCGCRPDQARANRLPNYRPPAEMLGRLGLSPGDIGHVVLTHLHWDHAGAAEMFPAARFWAHRAEIAFWLEDPVAASAPFRLLSDQPSLGHLADLRSSGRLAAIGEDGEFLPGLGGLAAPGHTTGLMAVGVETEKGLAVLGSDCGHFFANYRDEWPTSLISDLPAWVKSFAKLKSLAAPGLLFPGHDLLMSTDYPALAEGITRLA